MQVMWLLSGKVSEDIFRKQLERIVGAVATHLQQQQQGERPITHVESLVTLMFCISLVKCVSRNKVTQTGSEYSAEAV